MLCCKLIVEPSPGSFSVSVPRASAGCSESRSFTIYRSESCPPCSPPSAWNQKVNQERDKGRRKQRTPTSSLICASSASSAVIPSIHASTPYSMGRTKFHSRFTKAHSSPAVALYRFLQDHTASRAATPRARLMGRWGSSAAPPCL